MRFIKSGLAILSLPLALAYWGAIFWGVRPSALYPVLFLCIVSLALSMFIGGTYRVSAVVGILVLVSPLFLVWLLVSACAILKSPCP